MTEFSGAEDEEEFDGNTLLLECENNELVHISGLEIFKFQTDDKIIDYISLMGNNIVPYAIILGEKYLYHFFLYFTYFFLIEKREISLISYTIVTNLIKTIKLKKEL